MGTRGTRGTNYLSHKINELQKRRGRLNVSRETSSPVLRTLSLEHAGVGLHLDSLRELAELERHVKR
jgi:hypothetical protein